MQQLLETGVRSARAGIVATELLDEIFSPVHDAMTALTRDSEGKPVVYSSPRNRDWSRDRFSSFMAHLRGNISR
jgi:hypothetical protein